MTDLKVISRKDAKAQGLKRYFNGPGKPCSRGHVAERLVSTGNCLECARMHTMKFREDRPDLLIAYSFARNAAASEEMRADAAARAKEYYHANRDTVRASQKAAYYAKRASASKATLEEMRADSAARSRKHYHANRDAINARQAAKRAERRARLKAERAEAYKEDLKARAAAYREANKEEIEARRAALAEGAK